jgi:hypothetical protein
VTSSARTSPFFFGLCVALCISVTSLISATRGIPLIPEKGPVLEGALTAQDIWEGRGLESPRYYELLGELERASRESGAAYWQDVFAVSGGGRLVSKHPLLLSLIAAPFYGVFGNWGFWLLTLILVLVIFFALRGAAEKIAGRDCGMLVLVVGLLGTQIVFYSYSLSYDLLAAALVICGYALLLGAPLWGSFLLTLSCLIRPAFILLALPLSAARGLDCDTRGRFDLAFGAAGALALLAGSNTMLWGGPLVTAYHRFPQIVGGALAFPHASMTFSLAVFAADWGKKLFGSEVGVLRYNLAVFGALFFPAVWTARNSYRRFLLLSMAIVFANALVIFSYLGWDVTGGGNRYLMGMALILALIAAVSVRTAAGRIGGS